MTNQQRRDFRKIYNQLRAGALRPGDSLTIKWLEYDGDKRRLLTKSERMQKWMAA